MPSDNRISAEVTDAVKAQIIAKIAEARALVPFLINLTLDERKVMPKMKDKTLAFDQKCAGYMAARPELVPSYVSPAELAKDRALVAQLNDIDREIMMFAEAIEDTATLAGHEAYMADLSFYQNVRQAAKRGVTGADTIYEDLRQRFPGRPSATPPPTP